MKKLRTMTGVAFFGHLLFCNFYIVTGNIGGSISNAILAFLYIYWMLNCFK